MYIQYTCRDFIAGNGRKMVLHAWSIFILLPLPLSFYHVQLAMKWPIKMATVFES